MSSNFEYITGLNNVSSRSEKHRKSHSLQNNIFRKDRLLGLLDKSKNRFINHMITNEARYSDLDKIESEISKTIDKNSHQINLNNDSIQRKSKYLEELNTKINCFALETIKLDKDEIDRRYKEKTSELERKIEAIEFDYYKLYHIYEDLYTDNYITAKQLSDQLKTSGDNDIHYGKYLAINTKVIKTFEEQFSLLGRMKNLYSTNEKDIQTKLEIRQKEYWKENKEVLDIKKKEAEDEVLIDQLREEEGDLLSIISEVTRRNNAMSLNLKHTKRDFLLLNVQLLKIYNRLDVENLDEIIKYYKEGRIKYNSYSSEFTCLNTALKELNSEFTELSYLHANIQGKLRKKEKIFQNKDEEIDFLEDKVDLQGYVIEIKEATGLKQSIEQTLKDKEDVVFDSLNVLLKLKTHLDEAVVEFHDSRFSLERSKYNETSTTSTSLKWKELLLSNQNQYDFKQLLRLDFDKHSLVLLLKLLNSITCSSSMLFNNLAIVAQNSQPFKQRRSGIEVIKKSSSIKQVTQPNYLEIIDLNENQSQKKLNLLFSEVTLKHIEKIENEEANRDSRKIVKKKEVITSNFKVDKESMKNIFLDFWVSNQTAPELAKIDIKSKKILGNRLMPFVKKFMSEYLEDDIKKAPSMERKIGQETRVSTLTKNKKLLRFIEEDNQKTIAMNRIKLEEENSFIGEFEKDEEIKLEEKIKKKVKKQPLFFSVKADDVADIDKKHHFRCISDLQKLDVKIIKDQRTVDPKSSYSEILFDFLKKTKKQKTQQIINASKISEDQKPPKLMTFNGPKLKLYERKPSNLKNISSIMNMSNSNAVNGGVIAGESYNAYANSIGQHSTRKRNLSQNYSNYMNFNSKSTKALPNISKKEEKIASMIKSQNYLKDLFDNDFMNDNQVQIENEYACLNAQSKKNKFNIEGTTSMSFFSTNNSFFKSPNGSQISSTLRKNKSLGLFGMK